MGERRGGKGKDREKERKVVNKGMEEHRLGKGKDGGGQGKKESDDGGDRRS